MRLEKFTGSVTETFGFDPLGSDGFELDRSKPSLVTKLTVQEFEGTAAYNINDYAAAADLSPRRDGRDWDNIPNRIVFKGRGGDDTPSLTMGIEVRGGAPACTYLEFSAGESGDVRAKHLRPIRFEEFVTQIVVACAANHVVFDPQRGPQVYRPEVTRDDVRDVERMQRRRRDPRTDRELLERVADLYRRHPEAPNQAVATEFEVSERTAARWAGYCSEAGLLPKAPKQGQKRL